MPDGGHVNQDQTRQGGLPYHSMIIWERGNRIANLPVITDVRP